MLNRFNISSRKTSSSSPPHKTWESEPKLVKVQSRVRKKPELVLMGLHWKVWLIPQESLQSADNTSLYERCPLRCEHLLRVFRPTVIIEERRRIFSPVLSFLLCFVCLLLHACVCFCPGVFHARNKQNLLFSIVPFIVPFAQLLKCLSCSRLLKRKEGHCQRRAHHFVFCVAYFSYYNCWKWKGKWVLLVSMCVHLSVVFLKHLPEPPDKFYYNSQVVITGSTPTTYWTLESAQFNMAPTAC